MRENKDLIALGFKFREGDGSHTMNLSDQFYLEIDDKETPYILSNEEESLTGIIYTELTQEMVEKVNATMQILAKNA